MRHSTSKKMDSEKLTVKQFFSQLKIGQAWALLGIIAGLIAGAFVLGYKADSLVTEPKLAEKDTQLTAARLAVDKANGDLQKATADAGDAGTKERFLSLYLRYLLAQKQNDAAERTATKQALDDFVRQFVDAKALIIHKGGGHLATIKFSDGTSWEIPKELHSVAKE
jgi:hypothetical protein